MPIQYSFPTLKIKEILVCCKELEIPLTQDELKEPIREKMMSVYEAFVQCLMDVSREEMKQAPPNLEVAVDVFQFQELHEDSIPEITFYRTLLELMQTAGISDCTLSDFVNPEYMRTKKILSGLINFAKFREERLEIFHESTAKTYELRDLQVQLEEENGALEEQLTKLREMRKKVEPVIQTLEQDNNEFVASIENMNKENSGLRENIREVKETLTDLNDQIAKHNFLLLEAQQEVDKLQSQIVRSPEKLKKTLAGMTEDSGAKRQDIDELTAKLRELQGQYKVLKKLENKLVKRIAEAKECGQNVDRIKDLHYEIKKQQANSSDNDQAIIELKASAEHLQKQISNTQDKIYHLQRNFETKRYSVQQALEETERAKLELQRSTQQDKATLHQNASHNQRVQKEMIKLKKDHKQEIEMLRERYTSFQGQLTEYHTALRTAISM